MDGPDPQKDRLKRFYAPQSSPGKRVVLAPDEGHHLRKVLRLRAGEDIWLLDGQGGLFLGTIEETSPQGVAVRVKDLIFRAPPALPLVLVQAMLKGERLAWLIQKATELGATKIVLFESRRSVVRRTGGEKLRRLRRIALEALKQSGRLYLPEIVGPLPLKEALTKGAEEICLILHEKEGQRRLKDLLPQAGSGLSLAVGPEGGFEAEEIKLAQGLGYTPVRLGKAVLRSETAALAALAATIYELDL
ncbi:RsmE family RNA methyltransferase [Thermosulfuriphilus sp.]